MDLRDADFQQLLALRTRLRRFFRWSEEQARAAGLTPAQHQLLLAVRGHSDPAGPTVGEVAGYLLLRHHSASELIDRAAGAGLVARGPDVRNASAVRVSLTPLGRDKLSALTPAHLQELAELAPVVRALTQAVARFERSAQAHVTA